MSDQTQSKGEYLVGSNFNPGGFEPVNDIKRKAAALIDAINGWANEQSKDAADAGEGEQMQEIIRCKSLAITSIEQGAMWGVKSVTKPPIEKGEGS